MEPSPLQSPAVPHWFNGSFASLPCQITEITSPDAFLIFKHQLTKILQDCVDEGSSIGFLAPLSVKDAQTYWNQVSDLVGKGTLHLFIFTSTSNSNPAPRILGTVQLLLTPKVTHLHRAEVVKLLVSPSARRLGIARKLMKHVEKFAKETGRDMLTLDTATKSPALEMYRTLGWEEWGTCKGYACWPDGSRCDATFFRKEL